MSKAKEKYNFKEFDKHTENFKYIITEDGHTMMAPDIVKGLNQKEILLKKTRELELKERVYIKLIEYCLYDEDFDAQAIQIQLQEITNA